MVALLDFGCSDSIFHHCEWLMWAEQAASSLDFAFGLFIWLADIVGNHRMQRISMCHKKLPGHKLGQNSGQNNGIVGHVLPKTTLSLCQLLETLPYSQIRIIILYKNRAKMLVSADTLCRSFRAYSVIAYLVKPIFCLKFTTLSGLLVSDKAEHQTNMKS